MLTQRQLAELDSVPREELAAAEYEVTIGQLDITSELAECSYQGGDGRAWLLTALLNVELDDSYEQEDVVVTYIVRDKLYESFRGKAVTVNPMGGTTRIEAATGSYEAERVTIGDGDDQFDVEADDWDINNERPDSVLFTAAQLLPYTDVDLVPLSDPPVARRKTDGNAIKWYEYVEAAYSTVEELCQVRVVDDSLNVMRYIPIRPPRTDVASMWHIQSGTSFEFPDTDEIADETSSGTDTGERYARVFVRDSNGRRVGFARVDNGSRKVHPRSTLIVDMPEGAVDSGQQLATDTAAFIGINARSISAELLYPPFMLQRGMNIAATARTWAPGVLYERDFQFQADAITVDVKGRKGALAGSGRQLSSLTTPIDVTLPELDANVWPLWGELPDGRPYLDTLLPWLTDFSTEVEIDTEVAALYGILVTVDGDTVIIERGAPVPPSSSVLGNTAGELANVTVGELANVTLGELG